MTSGRGSPTGLEWAQGEARFRALLEHSSDIITVLAADGTVLYNTPAVGRVLGYQPEELAGKVALEFIHPDDVTSVRARSANDGSGTSAVGDASPPPACCWVSRLDMGRR